MRTLRFRVNKQIISQDPNCNFDGLVPGTEGYLSLHFTFSPEWKDCIKYVGFYSMAGRQFLPQPVGKDNTCLVPKEAARLSNFKIQITGARPDGNYTITSNRILIQQKGDKS